MIPLCYIYSSVLNFLYSSAQVYIFFVAVVYYLFGVWFSYLFYLFFSQGLPPKNDRRRQATRCVRFLWGRRCQWRRKWIRRMTASVVIVTSWWRHCYVSRGKMSRGWYQTSGRFLSSWRERISWGLSERLLVRQLNIWIQLSLPDCRLWSKCGAFASLFSRCLNFFFLLIQQVFNSHFDHREDRNMNIWAIVWTI